MKIGIDISQIVYEGTGVSRFTYGLVNAILEYDKSIDWVFFFSSFRQNLDPDIEKKIRDKGYRLIKWKLPPTLLSFLWNDFHQLKILSFKLKIDFDWFITSDWTEPYLNCKKAAIVHDLVFLRHPETVDKKILRTQKKRLGWIKEESDVIFADSLSTKKDLIDLVEIDSNKLFCNYPGVEVEVPDKKQIDKTLRKYKLEKPFILSVGKAEPRKNFNRLIEAFKGLKNREIDLVIAGPEGWEKEKVQSINLPAGKAGRLDNIRFLGYIDNLSLFSLYSSCLFFVYPSIWEGFGYPVIEAMKMGTPVITSGTSSLKEIAGNAALLFNPFDVDEIKNCLNMVIRDERLRESLSIKGLERSKIFTWRKYYENMINTLLVKKAKI